MNRTHVFGILAVVLLISLSLAPSIRADQFDDSITGPRLQLSAVDTFHGDVMFAQPTEGVSRTHGQTPTSTTGSGWVTDVSGYVFLPHGQSILKAEIVAGHQDPVRSQALAVLDYHLAAVTGDGIYYTLTLRSPVRIERLNDFSVMVLRNETTNGNASSSVSAMFNVVQTSK